MNTSIALSSVNFHGQSLLTTLVNEIPHVAIKPICENIGLDWDAQRQKIKRHPILSKGAVMITAPSNGGLQEMLMLPLKMLNGWLFGIDSSRVRPEIKDRVIEYQEECFDVLANHFMPKPQYGLKQLPPSPYISEAETLSLRRHIEAFCKGDQKLYKAMYHKLYKGYNIAKYDQLPAGKLNEALVFLGLNNIQLSPQTEFPEQNIITMTQAELLAHDEQVASEAVKRVQGELVSEPSQDGVMLFLKNYSEKERRFLVHTKMNAVQITPVADDCYIMTYDDFIQRIADKKGVFIIDKTKLDEITLKQLGKFLA